MTRPPSPPAGDRAGLGAGSPGWLAGQVQVLFAEARRRRTRRRLAAAAAVLAAAGLACGAVIAHHSGGADGRGTSRPAASGPGRAPAFTLPSARVAWFDGNGTLRIGDVATRAQRPVARLGWQPCCRLVTAGHRIYWAGRSKGRDYIQEYDLATGTISNVAPGWAVFAGASGQTVYVAQTDHRLLALPASSQGRARPLATPPGWQAVPLPWAAAGGIVLSSDARRPAIGVWQPRSGTIAVIGHGHVLATWTQPSGRGSLIAWQPAACPPQHCPVEITTTPSGHTLTVRSPARYGFLGQGNDMAFSPDGTELAALIAIGPLTTNSAPPFVPALVNTATGTVQLARRAVLANGELAGWLVWLPGSERLLAGPAADISRYAGYALNTQTGAASPFSFVPRSSYPADGASDITYGAVLIPRTTGVPPP